MLDSTKITNGEIQHREFVDSKFSDLINLYDRSYGLFLKSIYLAKEIINSVGEDNVLKIFIEIGMKINSDSRVLFYSIVNGWYATAESLFRDINDCIIKLELLNYFPDKATDIIENKLKTRQIRKILKDKKIPMPLGDEAWGKISQMKHAEGKWIFTYGEFWKGDSQLRFYPTVFAFLIEALFIFAIALILNSCEYFSIYFKKKFGEDALDSGYASELSNLVQIMKEKMTKS